MAMQTSNYLLMKLPIIALALGVLSASSVPVSAQDAPPVVVGHFDITGVPEDWTHHRVVFSNPGTEEEAIRKGTFEKWLAIVNDPRYVLQQVRRGLPMEGPAAEAVAKRALWKESTLMRKVMPIAPRPHRHDGTTINKDWNEALGSAGTPSYLAYPIKWSYNFTKASCAYDFVAYPTGQKGTATQASIIAYYNLYSGCGGTVPQTDWAYNTGGYISLAPTMSMNGNQIAFIQTVSSSSSTGTATFTATPAAGDQITVAGVQYIFETSQANCSGVNNCVVASGTTTQLAKNLEAAINNTASQCGTTSPCFYNVTANTEATATEATNVVTVTNNTGGAVVFTKPSSTTALTLSPLTGVIPGGPASLVLMQIPLYPPGFGTVGSPITLTSIAASSYVGCTAPCMTSIALSGNATDYTSNPYYDYTTDSLYVGDAVGKLHKFNPVFNGTPAEVTTSWPVQLARGGTKDTNAVSSPAYDSTTGYVLVGSTGTAASGAYGTGGYLYSIGSGNQGTTSGTIHGYSGQLDAVWGIRDAPLLDSAAGKAYVFAGNDGTGGAGAGNNNVYQFAPNFTTGSGTKVTLGAGGPSNGNTIYQLSGTFDNNYYSASNGASPSGYLYVGGTGDGGPLYQVAITSNAMGTVVTGPQLAYGTWYYGRYSPITEYYNTSVTTGSPGGTDYIFLSIFSGAPTGCNYGTTHDVAPFYGCVMSFDVTTPANFSSSSAPAGTFNMSSTEYTAATGGIIIDNRVSTPAGTSQLYFVTNQTTGTTPCSGICAVQVSQSAP